MSNIIFVPFTVLLHKRLICLFCYYTYDILVYSIITGTSSKLHKFLLDATLGAPIAFFDVTPIGRILNRFSSDMVVIDEELSQTISQLTNSLFSCIGAVGAIAGATKGTFLALCLPLIFLYERIQRYFRKSNTAIARNQSVSLSPIYADFSQALTGKGYHRYIMYILFINSNILEFEC